MFNKAIVILALFGAAFTNVKADEPVDTALQWIHCVHLALDVGLPDVGIPPHNPLVFSENLTFPINSSDLGVGFFALPNAEIDGILNYNFTQLEGDLVTFNNTSNSSDAVESRAILNYTIYWPDMTLVSDWVFETDVLGNHNGTAAIHLEHVNFSGVWDKNVTREGQPAALNNFTLAINVGEVETQISHIPLEGLNELILSTVVKLAFNSIPVDVSSALLEERLETAWLNNQPRIDAIIDLCRNSSHTTL